MFLDSDIVKIMQLKRNKIGYITYNIVLFFSKKLIENVNRAVFIIVCFDESFNKIIKR